MSRGAGPRPPVRIRWRGSEALRVAALLRDPLALAPAAGDERRLELGGLELGGLEGDEAGAAAADDRVEVVRPVDPRDSATRHARAAATPDPSDPCAPRLAAVGWATVDADRFAAERGWASSRAAAPLGRDPLLRASARRGPPGEIVLEPDAEGPLAAALARRGEGVAAVYLELHPELWEPARARLVDRRVSHRLASTGPLGVPELLLGPARPWGPFLLLVRAAR